jgi:hypothetical protein
MTNHHYLPFVLARNSYGSCHVTLDGRRLSKHLLYCLSKACLEVVFTVKYRLDGLRRVLCLGWGLGPTLNAYLKSCV